MAMNCRPECGACCIAPSISTPLPAHPHGKPAFEACRHLKDDLRCELFQLPQRPVVCREFTPTPEVCGDNREQALQYLIQLEKDSKP